MFVVVIIMIYQSIIRFSNVAVMGFRSLVNDSSVKIIPKKKKSSPNLQ